MICKYCHENTHYIDVCPIIICKICKDIGHPQWLCSDKKYSVEDEIRNKNTFKSNLDGKFLIEKEYLEDYAIGFNLDECYKITQEMQTILNHNFDVLFKNKERIKLVEFLHSEKKISKKLI